MNEPTIITGIEKLGIFERDTDAWVYSYDIAKLFGKRHGDVIRSVERCMEEVSEEFCQRNFASAKVPGRKGGERKAYRLNRKAFSYVVMGFTGERAAKFKEAYIEAFERMSDLIFTREVAKHGYKEMSAAVADCIGRDAKVFQEEADRVNLAVLGFPSREFRAVFHVPSGKNPRDSIPKTLLEKLDKAQRLNAQLIIAGMDDEARDQILQINFREAQL